MRSYCSCSCGATESEEHLPVSCALHSALRVDLLTCVKVILFREGFGDLLQNIMCNHVKPLRFLLFGHPSLKLKPTEKFTVLSLSI